MPYDMATMMTLLGKLTGWDDYCSVKMRYGEVYHYDHFDERSSYNPKKYRYYVSTTICGDDGKTLDAEGETPEWAISELCKKVMQRHKDRANHSMQRAQQAMQHMEEFLASEAPPPPNGPYR